MRRKTLAVARRGTLSFACALLAVAGAAAGARAQQGEAGRVTVAELKESAARGSVVIVDVRNEEIERKIKGAVHIPYNDLEGRAAELPREREIVTYCA